MTRGNPPSHSNLTPDEQDYHHIQSLANPSASSHHEEALSSLYDRHAGHLNASARRILGEIESRDIVQELFVFVWRHANRYDAARGSVGAWLSSMANSRSLDVLRARHTLKRTPLVDVTEPSAVPAAASAPNYAMLRASVALLPEAQRALVDLAYFEGLSHVEIAALTGLPLGTIKTRLRSAIRNLRLAVPRQSVEALVSGAVRWPIFQWLERRVLGRVADLYFVDLMMGNHVVRADWGHVEPTVKEDMDQAWRFVPPAASETHPVSRVLASGRPELVPYASPGWLAAASTSPQHLLFMRRLGLQSLICHPLRRGDRALGALTLVRVAPSGGFFVERDVRETRAIAETVASALP